MRGGSLAAAWASMAMVAMFALGSAAARASVEDGPDGTAVDPAREAVRRADEDLEVRRVGTLRARWAWPQRAAVAGGVLVARQPRGYDCTTVCDYRGWQFQLEAATGGVQLAAGYANLVAEKKRNRFFLSDVLTAFGVRGAIVRTFAESDLEPANQTFAGVEFAYTVTRVSFTLGLMGRISSAPEADRWRVMGGFGWGF